MSGNIGTNIENFKTNFANPYVHSSYSLYNFTTKAYAIGHNIQKNKLYDEYTKLKSVATQLASDYLSTFGTMSPSDIWKHIEGKDYYLKSIVMDFFTTQRGRSLLTQKVTLNPEELDRIFSEQVLNSSKDGIQETLMEISTNPSIWSNIMAKVMMIIEKSITIKNKKEFKIDENFLHKHLAPEFAEEVIRLITTDKVTKGSINKLNLTSFKNGSVLEKNIRKALLSYGANNKLISIYSTLDLIKTELSNYIKERKRTDTLIISSDQEIEIFCDKVIQGAKAGIANAYTNALASGVIGEDVFVNVMLSEVTKNSTNIIITGGLSEEKLRKTLQEDKNYNEIYTAYQNATNSVRNDEQQSYTDFVFTYNNRIVRVQSKTYIGALEAFRGRANGNKDIMQHMVLRPDEKILSFLTTMEQQQSNTTITEDDLNEIAYAVANEIWFSTHQSYDSKNTSWYNASINFNDTNIALTSIFMDYLGVMLDQNWQVQSDNSNMFYLIDGRWFIPTFKIVENLALIMENSYNKMINMKVYVQGSSAGNEKAFYTEKKDALIKNEASPGLHYPDYLLTIGKNRGSDIIQKSSLHIDLDASLQSLANSSYDIFKYEILQGASNT